MQPMSAFSSRLKVEMVIIMGLAAALLAQTIEQVGEVVLRDISQPHLELQGATMQRFEVPRQTTFPLHNPAKRLTRKAHTPHKTDSSLKTQDKEITNEKKQRSPCTNTWGLENRGQHSPPLDVIFQVLRNEDTKWWVMIPSEEVPPLNEGAKHKPIYIPPRSGCVVSGAHVSGRQRQVDPSSQTPHMSTPGPPQSP